MNPESPGFIPKYWSFRGASNHLRKGSSAVEEKMHYVKRIGLQKQASKSDFPCLWTWPRAPRVAHAPVGSHPLLPAQQELQVRLGHRRPFGHLEQRQERV